MTTQKKKQRPFEKMTKAQKRVAIAKDALRQIASKKINIATGTWANFTAKNRNHYMDVDQQSLKTKIKSCTACALGAALVSSIRLFDKWTINGLGAGKSDIRNQLGKFFSERQRILIEYAFEAGNGYYKSWNLPSRAVGAQVFHDRYPIDKDRAVAIFKNIVKNNGTFKP